MPSDADGELMSAMKRVSDQDAQIDELKKQVGVLAAEKQRLESGSPWQSCMRGLAGLSVARPPDKINKSGCIIGPYL